MIQVASDPLFSGYPIRGFPSDLTLGGAPRLTLEALAEAGARLVDPRAVAERRRLWETEHTRLRRGVGRARNGGRRRIRRSTWRGSRGASPIASTSRRSW